jgi:glycosyltransferase involved in cell wall biosynthesis
MKICHFVSLDKKPEKGPAPVSGLSRSVRELLEAELEMGVDAGFCDYEKEEGGEEVKLWRRTVQSKPWSWALDADANMMSAIPDMAIFQRLPHPIMFLHAIPFYCFTREAEKQGVSMTLNYAMLRQCEAAVCWSGYEAEYYRLLSEKPVHVLTRGVDLDYWSPQKGQEFRWHPSVTAMDVGYRFMKQPFTLLFAAKLAQRRLPRLKLNLFGLEPKTQATWDTLVAKLNMEIIVENMVFGLWPEPREIYCGSDILVSPTQWGLASRVAAEALACGCPMILLEGQEDKPASAKCQDSPGSMADAIVSLWERIEADPEGERKKARQIAEEHYGVKQTVRELIKIVEGL